MKKLNKLQINPERLMQNEELMTLRGGYGGYLKCEGGSMVLVISTFWVALMKQTKQLVTSVQAVGRLRYVLVDKVLRRES